MREKQIGNLGFIVVLVLFILKKCMLFCCLSFSFVILSSILNTDIFSLFCVFLKLFPLVLGLWVYLLSNHVSAVPCCLLVWRSKVPLFSFQLHSKPSPCSEFSTYPVR